MALEVRWVSARDEFEALAPAWDRLAERDPTPFSLHAWYAAWWDGYGGDRRLRVCTAWNGSELAGVLPLCEAGGRLEAMANAESALVRPLAADAGALRALTEAAARERYGMLEVRRLPERDPGIAALVAAARRSGRMALVEPDISSPIVDTTGTLEEYRHRTRSKWHKNMWRLYRRLRREQGATVSLIEAPRELAAELAAGFEVESSGWKAAAGSAILSQPGTTAFYRSLARRFHARDELRFSSVTLGERMIAWDFGILRHNRLYSPKSGYREEYRQLAPGLVLELATIERCFELGIEAHELLGSDEQYKLRFSTGLRRHFFVRAYPRRPLGLARYAWRRFAPRGARTAYSERLRPLLRREPPK